MCLLQSNQQAAASPAVSGICNGLEHHNDSNNNTNSSSSNLPLSGPGEAADLPEGIISGGDDSCVTVPGGVPLVTAGPEEDRESVISGRSSEINEGRSAMDGTSVCLVVLSVCLLCIHM